MTVASRRRPRRVGCPAGRSHRARVVQRAASVDDVAARGGRQAADSRRAQLEAARLAQQRATRRRQLVLAGVVILVAVLATVAALTLRPSSARPVQAAPQAATGVGLPPWPAPAEPQQGMQAAGLVSNPMEGAVQHFHAHLDILVDGRPVEVPADLGIDQHRGLIAELHTHDDSGVLHVESGDSHLTFTLGQLFTEWGVELDAEDLGGLHADGGEQLRAYVDGRPVEGDPGRIQLADHQEIALVYGAGQPGHVPDSYDFAAAGL